MSDTNPKIPNPERLPKLNLGENDPKFYLDIDLPASEAAAPKRLNLPLAALLNSETQSETETITDDEKLTPEELGAPKNAAQPPEESKLSEEEKPEPERELGTPENLNLQIIRLGIETALLQAQIAKLGPDDPETIELQAKLDQLQFEIAVLDAKLAKLKPLKKLEEKPEEKPEEREAPDNSDGDFDSDGGYELPAANNDQPSATITTDTTATAETAAEKPDDKPLSKADQKRVEALQAGVDDQVFNAKMYPSINLIYGSLDASSYLPQTLCNLTPEQRQYLYARADEAEEFLYGGGNMARRKSVQEWFNAVLKYVGTGDEWLRPRRLEEFLNYRPVGRLESLMPRGSVAALSEKSGSFQARIGGASLRVFAAQIRGGAISLIA